MTQPLIIKDWPNGVAGSPHEGIGMLRNVDIEAFPGAIKVQKAMTSMFMSLTTRTFTADAGTDVCTASGSLTTSDYTAQAVQFTTTGTLPAGLSLATNYFLINVTGSTFKVATTRALAEAGTAIDITGTGTGTHTITAIAPGTIQHIVEDKRTDTYYMVDSNGRVWKSTGAIAYLLAGNTLETDTSNGSKGLALLRTSDDSATYLFSFRNRYIDVVEVDAATPSWSNSWGDMYTGWNLGSRHHAIRAQDNIIYYTNGRYLGSIKELTVFVPGTPATYNHNATALDTPQGEVLEHIEEHGTNLLIAGSTYNKIYPWDRLSDSFGLPIEVPENIVKRLQNIGGTVYILAGTKGNIYTTQGTYARHFVKIPDYLVNNSGTLQSNIVTWGGIAQRDGALLVGLAGQTTGNSGVYLIYPDGRIVMDNMPSTGSALVSAIYAEHDFYKIGYVGGADYSSTSRYSAYESVIQSALYKVGNKTQKASYSTLEVQVAKPASSGHMRIKYRTDESSAFADFATAIVYTADSSATSFETDIGLIDIENLQLQIEMDGLFELIEVRLYP